MEVSLAKGNFSLASEAFLFAELIFRRLFNIQCLPYQFICNEAAQSSASHREQASFEIRDPTEAPNLHLISTGAIYPIKKKLLIDF